MASTLALFGTQIGWMELVLLGLIALIIFGRRLPEVGRSLGRGIVEFKKGLAGLEEEVEGAGKDKEGPPKQLEEGAKGESIETRQPETVERKANQTS